MNKRNILLLAGLLIILALTLIIIFDNSRQPGSQAPAYQNSENTNSNQVLKQDAVDPFRSEVPTGIKVPEANEVLSEAQQREIAVPQVVAEAAPGAVSQFRSFNIYAQEGKFVPEKVIANLGDTVKINFTAVDQDYDIYFPSYKMKQAAKKGETKILQFQARKEGSFLYYCEACGGPNAGPTGSIIIVD